MFLIHQAKRNLNVNFTYNEIFAKTLNTTQLFDLVEENAFNNHLTRVKQKL